MLDETEPGLAGEIAGVDDPVAGAVAGLPEGGEEGAFVGDGVAAAVEALGRVLAVVADELAGGEAEELEAAVDGRGDGGGLLVAADEGVVDPDGGAVLAGGGDEGVADGSVEGAVRPAQQSGDLASSVPVVGMAEVRATRARAAALRMVKESILREMGVCLCEGGRRFVC